MNLRELRETGDIPVDICLGFAVSICFVIFASSYAVLLFADVIDSQGLRILAAIYLPSFVIVFGIFFVAELNEHLFRRMRSHRAS